MKQTFLFFPLISQMPQMFVENKKCRQKIAFHVSSVYLIIQGEICVIC